MFIFYYDFIGIASSHGEMLQLMSFKFFSAFKQLQSVIDSIHDDKS